MKLAPGSQVDLIGVVSKAPKKSLPLIFKVKCAKIDMTFNCICNNDIPIKINDQICAVCKIIDQENLEIINFPYVRPNFNKSEIIKVIKYSTNITSKEAAAMYYYLMRVSKCDEREDSLIDYLSDIADRWYRTRIQSLLDPFKMFDLSKAKLFMSTIHNKYTVRRLQLLNFNRRQLLQVQSSLNDFYDRCLVNPKSIYFISDQQCEHLISCFNLTPTDEENFCGDIIRYVAGYLDNYKWTSVPLDNMIVKYPNLMDFKDVLSTKYDLIFDNGMVYLKYPYQVETHLTNFIHTKITNYSTDKIDPVFISTTISEEQKDAVSGALNNPISIITGIPGSGKSFCIGELVNNLQLIGRKFVICSFTGKAVARVKEIITSGTLATIHRLIQNSVNDDELEIYDHVIIDEVSMVTSELLYKLLLVYPDVKYITMLGDINQLQPNNWGNVFAQLMKSNYILKYNLCENFRISQNNDGIIINSANMMNDINFKFTNRQDFSVYSGGIDLVETILTGCEKAQVPPTKIIVLCPYNRDLPIVNSLFQKIFFKNKGDTNHNGKRYIKNDRVMLIENNHDINVYNGETGIIEKVTSNGDLWIDFGGLESIFFDSKLDSQNNDYYSEYYNKNNTPSVSKLTNGNVLTIDKSQGSEWDIVLIYISSICYGNHINKNRIYTAMTRCRKKCFIITPNISHLEEVCSRDIVTPEENLSNRLESLFLET
jgi:hypothetical protein